MSLQIAQSLFFTSPHPSFKSPKTMTFFCQSRSLRAWHSSQKLILGSFIVRILWSVTFCYHQSIPTFIHDGTHSYLLTNILALSFLIKSASSLFCMYFINDPSEKSAHLHSGLLVLQIHHIGHLFFPSPFHPLINAIYYLDFLHSKITVLRDHHWWAHRFGTGLHHSIMIN